MASDRERITKLEQELRITKESLRWNWAFLGGVFVGVLLLTIIGNGG